MATIKTRLTNQYKFKNQTVFSAGFDKRNEANQVFDETELYINLNIIHTLTVTNLDIKNVMFSSEEQIQNQEMKDLGWRFDKIISLTLYL